MQRGEIRWANLPAPSGSAPGYRRPVLIVQNDAFNRSGLGTVVAAVITSNLRLGEAPGNVVLSRRQSGLPRPAVVNVSQIITVDRSWIGELAGRLDDDVMTGVENGLKLVLALSRAGPYNDGT